MNNHKVHKLNGQRGGKGGAQGKGDAIPTHTVNLVSRLSEFLGYCTIL